MSDARPAGSKVSTRYFTRCSEGVISGGSVVVCGSVPVTVSDSTLRLFPPHGDQDHHDRHVGASRFLSLTS